MEGGVVEIFFSFIRKESNFYIEIRSHLSLLERKERIHCRSSEDVKPGADREREMQRLLDSSAIIVLLVSPAYLASDEQYQELERAMKRQQENMVRVVPILLRSGNYKDAPFARLNALPTKSKPLAECNNRDKVMSEIAAEIEKVISSAFPTSSQGTSSTKDSVQPTLSPRLGHSRKISFIGLAILLVVVLIGGGFHVLINALQPDIILCLTTTSYTPDFNPSPDHGILHPVYLKTNFTLVNRSIAQSSVTFVHISILGRIVSGPITRNTRNSVDWAPTEPVVVAGKAIVPNIKVSTVVDVMTEITSFQSAESQVTWTGGLGKLVDHTFNNNWQNDPACSS